MLTKMILLFILLDNGETLVHHERLLEPIR